MSPFPWGGANTEFEVENASAEELARMFKEEPPEAFFDTATSNDRQVHANGQRFDMNPMGRVFGKGADVLHDEIGPWESGDRDGHDIKGELSGWFTGTTRVDNDQVGRNVRVREVDTRIRPNLRKVPVLGTMQTIAESVPVFGLGPRGARWVAETMIGKSLETMHVLSAGRSADEIEATINRRRKR